MASTLWSVPTALVLILAVLASLCSAEWMVASTSTSSSAAAHTASANPPQGHGKGGSKRYDKHDFMICDYSLRKILKETHGKEETIRALDEQINMLETYANACKHSRKKPGSDSSNNPYSIGGPAPDIYGGALQRRDGPWHHEDVIVCMFKVQAIGGQFEEAEADIEIRYNNIQEWKANLNACGINSHDDATDQSEDESGISEQHDDSTNDSKAFHCEEESHNQRRDSNEAQISHELIASLSAQNKAWQEKLENIEKESHACSNQLQQSRQALQKRGGCNSQLAQCLMDSGSMSVAREKQKGNANLYYSELTECQRERYLESDQPTEDTVQLAKCDGFFMACRQEVKNITQEKNEIEDHLLECNKNHTALEASKDRCIVSEASLNSSFILTDDQLRSTKAELLSCVKDLKGTEFSKDHLANSSTNATAWADMLWIDLSKCDNARKTCEDTLKTTNQNLTDALKPWGDDHGSLRAYKDWLDEKNNTITDKEGEISGLKKEQAEIQHKLDDKTRDFDDKVECLTNVTGQLADKKAEVASKDAHIEDLDKYIGQLNATIANRDATIAKFDLFKKNLQCSNGVTPETALDNGLNFQNRAFCRWLQA